MFLEEAAVGKRRGPSRVLRGYYLCNPDDTVFSSGGGDVGFDGGRSLGRRMRPSAATSLYIFSAPPHAHLPRPR
uniref:Uncharacterized protein n=1 Tax=Triticum urartu TaxID=4572 RepID=A0A8R7PKC6_TRIUA